jgi:hypothetical protein
VFLALNNMLYDAESKRITGLLDFDFAAITNPCEEFLTGLWDIGGGIHERVGKAQPSVISGDFGTQPDGLSENETRAWEIAKAWDAAMEANGGIRPSSIVGLDRIQALRELEEMLAPRELVHPVVLKRIPEGERPGRKQEKARKISQWLWRYSHP